MGKAVKLNLYLKMMLICLCLGCKKAVLQMKYQNKFFFNRKSNLFCCNNKIHLTKLNKSNSRRNEHLDFNIQEIEYYFFKSTSKKSIKKII